MTDKKHTPTPWEIEQHKNGAIYITSDHAYPGDIADLYHTNETGRIFQKENALANAELIVRACNVHDDLVKALCRAEIELRAASNKFYSDGHRDYAEKMDQTIELVAAALAKASGGDND